MPLMERIASGLTTLGLLVVGECQRRALATRASGATHQHVYLSPLPFTGTTAEAMAAWSSAGVGPDSAGKLERRYRVNTRGDEGLAAAGYEVERSCGREAGAAVWSERVCVVRSPLQAERQVAGREARLAHAEQTLGALTPARGRGQRQITDAATRLEAMNHVRKEPRVEGFRTVAWARPVERHTHDVGRGRGAATRDQRGRETIRDPMTPIARREGPMAELVHRCGGKALVTHATPERLSWADAGLCSRNEDRIERMVHRLKSRVSMAPLCVKRDDHMQGLTYLLTWGVRGFTGLEVVLRRSWDQEQTTLPCLHPEHRPQMTNTPTAERLLKACSAGSLTIVKTAAGEHLRQRLTPWSALQQDILQRRGLDRSL